MKGHIDVVHELLANGAAPNGTEASSPSSTALQLVIDDAQDPPLEVLAAMLEAGADIDARDERGERALASAAFMGCYDAVRLLLERGARIDGRNENGVTPRDWAERLGHTRIVDLWSAGSAR